MKTQTEPPQQERWLETHTGSPRRVSHGGNALTASAAHELLFSRLNIYVQVMLWAINLEKSMKKEDPVARAQCDLWLMELLKVFKKLSVCFLCDVSELSGTDCSC